MNCYISIKDNVRFTLMSNLLAKPTKTSKPLISVSCLFYF
nr:MAG TPA_asm: hypothetical protein [Caudoviricetes sp.]